MLKLDVKSAVVQGAINTGKAFVIGGAGAYAAKAFYHHRRNKAIAEQREKKLVLLTPCQNTTQMIIRNKGV